VGSAPPPAGRQQARDPHPAAYLCPRALRNDNTLSVDPAPSPDHCPYLLQVGHRRSLQNQVCVTYLLTSHKIPPNGGDSRRASAHRYRSTCSTRASIDAQLCPSPAQMRLCHSLHRHQKTPGAECYGSCTHARAPSSACPPGADLRPHSVPGSNKKRYSFCATPHPHTDSVNQRSAPEMSPPNATQKRYGGETWTTRPGSAYEDSRGQGFDNGHPPR